MTPPVPLFSVVIPTRNRVQLAEEAIAAALAQTAPRDSYELLVLENSDPDQALRSVPEGVRIFPTTQTLTMPDNWERALDLCRGRYVVLLSDKDRLIPSALARLAAVIQAQPADIVTFRKGVYFNNTWTSPTALDGSATVRPTAPLLRAWFDQLVYLMDAPMLYNSAISRQLLLSIRQQHGRLFFGSSPDVSSSVFLLSAEQTYLDVNRRLVGACSGSWGNGVSMDRGLQGRALTFAKEFASNPILDAGLVFSVCGAIVETLLACKASAPALFAGYDINWERYVINTISVLQDRQQQGISTWRDWQSLIAQAGSRYPAAALVRSAPRAARVLLANQVRRAFPTRSRRGQAVRTLARRFRVAPEPACQAVPVTTSDVLSLLEKENAGADRALATGGDVA